MKLAMYLSFVCGICVGSLLFPSKGFATLSGNPGQPGLQTKGIVLENPSWWDLRFAYFGDYVYSQPSQDTFIQEGAEREQYHMQLWTQAGMVTINIRDWVDLYGIVGGLRIQNNNEMFTPQQFAWGVGGKVVFLHIGKWRAGCDIKYFQSEQAPQFFQSGHLAYNITSSFSFLYTEVQAALGLTYRTRYVAPYASVSYLNAQLSPTPPSVFLRIPSRNREMRVPIKSVSIMNHFGLVLGATLIDIRTATLSLEWRAFNQNSIDLTGEIRF